MVKKEKLHICFIGAGLAGGGMERSLTNIANYAANSGHKVTILNLFKTEVFFDLHADILLIWPDIDRSKMHRLLYAVKLIPYIRRNLKKLKPDTVLSFGEWFNSYVIIATRFLNIPIYVSDRMGPLLNLGLFIETARKLTYRYATGTISQTRVAAEILRNKTGARNIEIIPNALNEINTDISVKKKQIVTVGRLSREKGHEILLKAFAKLNASEWSLHIVGDGRERDTLEKLSTELCINEKVIFYGHLKDFKSILGQSEIFVLPSFYEGFPNALIEAMSVPLACISSNCIAGPSDIIEHGVNGLLYEPENISELASLINQLIDDKEYRMKLANNAMEIRDKLDIQSISDKYLKFILSGKTKLVSN